MAKIPSTFTRREGAPKEREILTARCIDRALRPLFKKGFFYETQARSQPHWGSVHGEQQTLSSNQLHH